MELHYFCLYSAGGKCDYNTDIYTVTIDPGSKPDQKYARRRERQKISGKNKVKLRASSKRILLCAIYWYIVRVWIFKVTGIKFMTVFITRRDAACF